MHPHVFTINYESKGIRLTRWWLVFALQSGLIGVTVTTALGVSVHGGLGPANGM